jgi:glycosyltransferase involved in cell wall biosynthesis
VLLAIDGVIRKVVEDAGAGLYSPPGQPEAMAQSIRRLLADPQATKQMGLNGRACIERRFNRSRLAEQMALIFEEMGKKHG